MRPADRINLALRAATETGVVVALAWWGVHSGGSPTARVLLGVGAPLLGFGLWGMVDFRGHGRWSEPLRLTEELVISGGAALAAYVAGQPLLGTALAVVSLTHHALVYALGGRLLPVSGPRAG